MPIELLDLNTLAYSLNLRTFNKTIPTRVRSINRLVASSNSARVKIKRMNLKLIVSNLTVNNSSNHQLNKTKKKRSLRV
jgi:hypothetical protein